jgi:glycosyltransferase involved in cell wall biosynthesis
LEKNPIFSSLIFNNSFQNIAPSGYLKYEFEIKGYATQLVPNVISIANYKFKKRIKLKPKLLYVRAFANVYNPCMSIEVFKEIKKKYQKAVLCMVGPDKDGTLNDVKQLIDRYELHDSVEITGVLSKSEWHKKSEEFDVFINTTNVDNTPVSVIEAMALGFPIVSTNVGGMPFLVENNKDGVLVEKNNAIEMTIRIIEILEKNNISLAKNARIKAESFDCNIVKNKWFEILK